MNSFTNLPLDPGLLPEFEHVELTSISKKYLTVIYFNLTLFSIIFIALLVISLLKKEAIEFSTLEKTIIITVASFTLIIINLLYLVAFRRKAYAFREKDMIYRSGLISEVKEIVPYNRLQHVIIRQSWLSRILGIATLQLYTAATTKEGVKIPGIEKETAYRLKDFLLHTINGIHLENTVSSAENRSL